MKTQGLRGGGRGHSLSCREGTDWPVTLAGMTQHFKHFHKLINFAGCTGKSGPLSLLAEKTTSALRKKANHANNQQELNQLNLLGPTFFSNSPRNISIIILRYWRTKMCATLCSVNVSLNEWIHELTCNQSVASSRPSVQCTDHKKYDATLLHLMLTCMFSLS